MPLKVKKHKKRKQVRYANKKKLKKNYNKTPKLKSKLLQDGWNHRKAVSKNLKDMGLSIDPNADVKTNMKNRKVKTGKLDIRDKLESTAKMRRVKTFELPQSQAKYLSFLSKTYGDNYKEMAKDASNVHQQTWKQIRSKMNQFKKLKQYELFMAQSNIIKRPIYLANT